MFKIAIATATNGDFRELSQEFVHYSDAANDAKKLKKRLPQLPALQILVVPVRSA